MGTPVRDLEQAVCSAQLAIEVLAGALSADPEEKEWAAQVRRVQDLPANQITLIVEDMRRAVTAMTRFAEKLSHTRA